MKNTLTTLAFVLYVAALYPANSMNKIEPDTNQCLKVDGKIINGPEKGEGFCRIELLCKNMVVDSAILKDGKKKFSFTLRSDGYYTLRISMKDHFNKLVCIDTRNTPLPDEDDLFRFSFETSLLHQNAAVNINTDYADYPIAIISYNAKTDAFNYNKEYTSNIKRDMHLTAKN